MKRKLRPKFWQPQFLLSKCGRSGEKRKNCGRNDVEPPDCRLEWRNETRAPSAPILVGTSTIGYNCQSNHLATVTALVPSYCSRAKLLYLLTFSR